MSNYRSIIVAAIALGLAGFASADTLRMGGTDNASRFESANKPSRGMSQASVEARYGPPSSRNPAIGDPPISRWEYANFVVFFEYDHVVHSVTKR